LGEYLLDAGEPVESRGVEAPKTTFKDAADPVALALQQERQVTEQIAKLVEVARKDHDLLGEQFLHWFLQEQREEVSSMSALLALVKRAADSNLLLVEEYLARTSVGDQGAPETGAPTAAGGAL